ncbi:MAG TPA: hypothetical protein VMN58_08585 [Acidimicrobiales bacterium]|nr:hypothetical protein [Acidimicrobiales bacterium]
MRRRDEIEALLEGTGDFAVAEALAPLRAAVDATEVPPAGGQLAAVFAEGVQGRTAPGTVPAVPAARPTRSRQRRRAVLGGAVGLALLTGTGGAGALPGPAQSVFDRASGAVGIDRANEERSETETPADEIVPVDETPPATLPDDLPGVARIDTPPATPGAAPTAPPAPLEFGPPAPHPSDETDQGAEAPTDRPATSSAPSDHAPATDTDTSRDDRAPDAPPTGEGDTPPAEGSSAARTSEPAPTPADDPAPPDQP